MIFLALSILCSSFIFVIFKLFERFGVNVLQAIIVNYFIALSVGLMINRQPLDVARIVSESWFPGVLVLGFLFIVVFNLAAITTQRSGLSVVAVASKMSVALPILFGIFLYNEGTQPLKITGILLALLAVYLTSIQKKEGISIKKENLIFPLLVFLGSGIIDTGIKFLETRYVAQVDVALFSSSIFAVAGVIGIGVLVWQAFRGDLQIRGKNILGGALLGIPNYGSIFFLVLALRQDLDSSTVFPINNVAIVLLSTFLGILFFGERLIPKNWLGISLAAVSILLIANA